jgi:hypothetical protein
MRALARQARIIKQRIRLYLRKQGLLAAKNSTPASVPASDTTPSVTVARVPSPALPVPEPAAAAAAAPPSIQPPPVAGLEPSLAVECGSPPRRASPELAGPALLQVPSQPADDGGSDSDTRSMPASQLPETVPPPLPDLGDAEDPLSPQLAPPPTSRLVRPIDSMLMPPPMALPRGRGIVSPLSKTSPGSAISPMAALTPLSADSRPRTGPLTPGSRPAAAAGDGSSLPPAAQPVTPGGMSVSGRSETPVWGNWGLPPTIQAETPGRPNRHRDSSVGTPGDSRTSAPATPPATSSAKRRRDDGA